MSLGWGIGGRREEGGGRSTSESGDWRLETGDWFSTLQSPVSQSLLPPPSSLLPQGFQKPRLHLGVPRDERAEGGARTGAGEVGGDAARLADDDDPRGHVPGGEVELPEGVEAAAGHVAEVERGG